MMGPGQEYKQVIAVRTDIRMSRGKLAAQVAHAAVEAVLLIIDSGNPEWSRWLREWRIQGQKKVVVKVSSEQELLWVHQEARRLGLPASLVADAGRTELPPGTRTAAAVGPAPSQLVDRVTGRLKLL
ncbi:peptidyl-tRNA hydrolase [Pyrodictium occultum]|uniref:Peptidyl-tRNA hydrolase n=2 Tax=Pyrodictium occultum TaxID=2309 RepID=A0A0V8RTX6_PYROC|nr:peptidyl-tRNA hydrolase Pth2 [Pyrodictium occultum]KSW11521.1 peptidyl-tRNA hydrolase [Pyrodictium occultum]